MPLTWAWTSTQQQRTLHSGNYEDQYDEWPLCIHVWNLGMDFNAVTIAIDTMEAKDLSTQHSAAR